MSSGTSSAPASSSTSSAPASSSTSSLESTLEKIVLETDDGSEYYSEDERLAEVNRLVSEYKITGAYTVDGEKITPTEEDMTPLKSDSEYEYDRISLIDYKSYIARTGKPVENFRQYRYLIIFNKICIRVHLETGDMINDTPHLDTDKDFTPEDEELFFSLANVDKRGSAMWNLPKDIDDGSEPDESSTKEDLQQKLYNMEREANKWKAYNALFNMASLLAILGFMYFLTYLFFM